MRKIIIIVLILLCPASFGQNSGVHNVFSKIVLQTDTQLFVYPSDTVNINKVRYFFFAYHHEEEVISLMLYPERPGTIASLSLALSTDYEVLDSIRYIDNSYYYVKLRFRSLSRNNQLRLNFIVKGVTDSIPLIKQLQLLPCTQTIVQLRPVISDLYLGEEMVFELFTNMPENVRTQNVWSHSGKIDYRITEKFGQLRLHVVPSEVGNHILCFRPQVYKPYLTKNRKLSYDMPEISHEFTVKKGRLQFLNCDKNDITLDDQSRLQGIDMQIDYSPAIQLEKTYRIENQEAPGGPLFGELFTRSLVGNNKVLCTLRVFNYYRKTDGYLYIKDGDRAKFLTNFNITPQTSISEIHILRPGNEWTSRLIVYPGETIEVKIKGDGLHKARFTFEDAVDVSEDSLMRSEKILIYRLKIPLTINKKRITIYNNGQSTGYSFRVDEFQRPKSFDYAYINIGDGNRKISNIRQPIFYDKVIKDINITFNDNQIDDMLMLYGRQYISIDIRVTNKKNELVEMRQVGTVVVCPGLSSPRSAYYRDNTCTNTEISLNNVISRKTYDLDEWSKIELNISHQKDKYGGAGETKKIDIYLRRKAAFDIDVSFPAGLITVYKQEIKDKEGNVTGKQMDYGSLGGISMAMIAQFSFYHPEKIAKLRPYKFGAGFIALNAFNFSDSKQQDLGLVVLASLYPISRDSKLTVPLYLGGGYLLKAQSPMFLIGPGIRVRL